MNITKQICNVLKNEKFNLSLIIVFGELYLINKIFLSDLNIPYLSYFLKCYCNDLICQLVFLPIVNIILAFGKYKVSRFVHLLSVGFTVGLFWEYVAPLFVEDSVSDPIDLCCYVLGTIFYWIALKSKNLGGCYGNVL